jgi:hypothetical protein
MVGRGRTPTTEGQARTLASIPTQTPVPLPVKAFVDLNEVKA